LVSYVLVVMGQFFLQATCFQDLSRLYFSLFLKLVSKEDFLFSLLP